MQYGKECDERNVACLDFFFLLSYFFHFIHKKIVFALATHLRSHNDTPRMRTLLPKARGWDGWWRRRRNHTRKTKQRCSTHPRYPRLVDMYCEGTNSCCNRAKEKRAQRKKNNSTERRKRKKRGEKLMAIINLPLHFEWQVKVGGVATRHRHGSAAILFSTTSLNSSPFSLRRFVCESFLIKKREQYQQQRRQTRMWCETANFSGWYLNDSKLETLFLFSVCYVFWWAGARTCDVMWNFNMGTFHLKYEIKKIYKQSNNIHHRPNVSMIFNYASASRVNNWTSTTNYY